MKENENVSDWTQARRKPEYIEVDRVIHESPAVKNWMRKLRGNHKVYHNVLRQWLWWLKDNEPWLYELGPDGLIDYRKSTRGTDDEFVINDAIEGWLYDNGGRYNTLRTYRSNIRSFFMHNRAGLAKDPTQRLKPTRYSRVSMFEIEEIRAIYSVSKPMLRAVMISLIMGGIGCDELLYWSKTGYRSLVTQLEDGELLIKVEYPGRKSMKGIEPHYTFLGRDAIRALKDWLKEREKYVNRDNCEYIFITTHGNPLTYPSLYHTWMRVLRRLKLIPKQQKGTHRRYGKNLHELRDFYRTRWQKTPSFPECWRVFHGSQDR